MTDGSMNVPDPGLAYDAGAMQRLLVDVEHLGVRLGVPLAAAAALLLAFWGGPRLLDALGLTSSQVGLCLFPLAIGAAVAAAFLSDRLIKRFWPSTRVLLLDDRHLILEDHGRPEAVIDWNGRVNMLSWRFKVKRRGRVPKGHLCLAVQLVQDDAHLTVYTFVSPKESGSVEDFDAFTPLAPRRTLKDERLSLRVAGQQRRLLQAEDERWEHGAELASGDFLILWEAIRRHGAVPQV